MTSDLINPSDVWMTDSDINIVFASGENAAEALVVLAAGLVDRGLDDLVIDLQILVEDEGVTVGAVVEHAA